MTVSRVWRGWSSAANGREYAELVAESVLPGMKRLPGYLGASFQRRETDTGEVEFLVITRWESLDDIRGFAGEDYETATIPDEAALLLNHYDRRALHYEEIAGGSS